MTTSPASPGTLPTTSPGPSALARLTPEQAHAEVLARYREAGLGEKLRPAVQPTTQEVISRLAERAKANLEAVERNPRARTTRLSALAMRAEAVVDARRQPFVTDNTRRELAKLHSELSASGARPNPALAAVSTKDLLRVHLGHTQQTIDGAFPRQVSAADLNEAMFRTKAGAVALLLERTELSEPVNGRRSILNPRTYRQRISNAYREDLCGTVPRANQRTAGFGTAFLVRPNRIVSAGHNFRGGVPPENMYVLFNFHPKADDTPADVADADVFRIRKIRLSANPREDWAVAELDRPASTPGSFSRMPVPVNADPARPPVLPQNFLVQVLGHPNGLPLCESAPGRVLRFDGAYFIAPLSTFEGNSGSPVFDAQGVVQGILIGASAAHRRQYVSAGGCQLPVNYTSDARNGEMCMRMSVVAPFIDAQLLDVPED